MTGSEKFRLILAIVLIILYLAKHYNWLGKLREGKEKRNKKEERQRLLAQRKDRRKHAQQQRHDRKAQTTEILKRAIGPLSQRSVQVAGQETWCLEGLADSEKRPVLLLHGFAGDKETWIDVGRQLVEAGHRVIAPDLPGFGQNNKYPDLPHDVTTLTKRIRALVQKLRLKSYHLVGHSIGGTIAAAIAYSAPKEIASLTLIEPFGLHVPYESELDKLLANERNPLVIAAPAAYNNLLGFVFHEIPDMPPALKKHRAELAAESRVFYLKVWKEFRDGERANLLDLLLPVIKAKTLVIQGSESKVIHPSTPGVIQAMMNDAREVVIGSCGHFPMVEKPAETGQHLLEFLASIPEDGPVPTAVPNP